ncbi:hypothetical protein [Bradyrhizobium liaoningense]|uniref:hypothetical protein n=1 Tax=Bradyrhizobium liaoningense TaxID=43992 RepID=UPI0020119E39|nr:hypothetical protein [Bradyrhizobium liaoningense]
MLLAVLWTKATHTREGSLQPRRRKVDERAHLDRPKPVGRKREWDGQRCRLEIFKRSRPIQTKVRPSNIRTVTRSLFLRDHLGGLNVGVNNPTGAIMGEIIRLVSKFEREHILIILEARDIRQRAPAYRSHRRAAGQGAATLGDQWRQCSMWRGFLVIKIIAVLCSPFYPTNFHEQTVTTSGLTDISMQSCLEGVPQLAEWMKQLPAERLTRWRVMIGNQDRGGA